MYPRYEQDVCDGGRVKEELDANFSECILDPPKSAPGLLRPITNPYVSDTVFHFEDIKHRL
jgi:hypothetical protein